MKVQAGTKGDAEVLQPTLMNFAPAVLEKIYVGLDAKVKAGGDLGYSHLHTQTHPHTHMHIHTGEGRGGPGLQPVQVRYR